MLVIGFTVCRRNVFSLDSICKPSYLFVSSRRFSLSAVTMKHHLMIGTWTPPGAIFTVEFDDEALTLKLVKRTAIPEDEPISWMTFDVSRYARPGCLGALITESAG